MFLAIPLMAVCLYMFPRLAPWYISYVVMFNMLVGPVFSAGAVTSERERQTLDLLLCTMITPLQILFGKLIAGLRVSSVLTSFLLWPVLLASLMVASFWGNLGAIGAYLSIVALSCLTTATLALFCSTCFRKTSASLMTTYLVIIALYCAPLAAVFFANTFFANTAEAEIVEIASATSPFAAAFAVPLDPADTNSNIHRLGAWWLFGGYALFTLALVTSLLGLMVWMFHTRWRVAE
jgi:ABC-type transport system involved in multi-copper enzyme maturation permease subunit